MTQYILKDKNNKNWTGYVVINNDGTITIKETIKRRRLKRWVSDLLLYIIILIDFILILNIEYNIFNAI